MTIEMIQRIRIEAPGAAAAFELERRLSHLHASVVDRGPRWAVELDDAEGRTEEIEATVRHWLRDRALSRTVMHVDGLSRSVQVLGEREPLGAGYDAEGVLEHEP